MNVNKIKTLSLSQIMKIKSFLPTYLLIKACLRIFQLQCTVCIGINKRGTTDRSIDYETLTSYLLVNSIKLNSHDNIEFHNCYQTSKHLRLINHNFDESYQTLNRIEWIQLFLPNSFVQLTKLWNIKMFDEIYQLILWSFDKINHVLNNLHQSLRIFNKNTPYHTSLIVFIKSFFPCTTDGIFEAFPHHLLNKTVLLWKEEDRFPCYLYGDVLFTGLWRHAQQTWRWVVCSARLLLNFQIGISRVIRK